MTICTRNRLCLFGEIVEGEMVLNSHGHIARDEWRHSIGLREELGCDAFVVMPNHVHGIVVIRDSGGFPPVVKKGDPPVMKKGDPPVAPTDARTLPNGPRRQSLGSFVAGYKSSVTRCISRPRLTAGVPGGSSTQRTPPAIWQRNYHDHIIRDERELARIRAYIRDNPRQWESDRFRV